MHRSKKEGGDDNEEEGEVMGARVEEDGGDGLEGVAMEG